MAAAAPEAASDPLTGTAAEQPAVAAGARARAPSAGDSPARQIDQPNRTPVPGSWADLSQRLERLPYGHPSSPYHVDGELKPPPPRDRKSTRLNSSHDQISYAVFCLKKKTKKKNSSFVEHQKKKRKT